MPNNATVIAALVAAAASLVVAVVSAVLKQRSDGALERFKADRTEVLEGYKADLNKVLEGYKAALNKALESYKSELDWVQAVRGARLSYEYEARKHLYAEFYPLLFQLMEACESAYNRIGGMAIAAREQQLRGFLRDRGYRFSTVYRLFFPLAVFRLCQAKLTSVDLTVDPWVRAQYLTAKQLYGIWISAAELAEAKPGIRYKPISPDSGPRNGDAVDPWQHLSVAGVELLIEALQVQDDKGPRRCRTFGEFIAWYERVDSDGQAAPLRNSIASAMELFEDFYPGTRPVLWRSLLAEARLSKLLIGAFGAHTAAEDGQRPEQPAGDLSFTDQERAELDWTTPDTPAGQQAQLADSFRAVSSYLEDRLTLQGLYPPRTTEATGHA